MKNKSTHCLFILSLLILFAQSLFAQCLVNHLTLNTGYNPAANAVYPTGTQDPYWAVTANSAASQAAATNTPPYQAYIVYLSNWVSNPTSQYISLSAAFTYSTISSGNDSLYSTTLTRTFHNCYADTYTFSLRYTADNWLSGVFVDGVSYYYQSATLSAGQFTAFNTIPTFSVYLPAGTHQLSAGLFNYPIAAVSNPTGLNIIGTVTGTFNSLLADTCSATSASVQVPSHHDTICAGGSAVLTATGTGSFSWTPTTGLSSSSGTSVTASPTVTTTYHVMSTGTGCITATDSVTVVVATPAGGIGGSFYPACANDTLPIRMWGISSPGMNYHWSGPNGFLSTDSSVVTHNPSTLNNGTYYLYLTNTRGCSTPTQSLVVTIVPHPAMPTVNNVTYCQYDAAIPLTATGSSGSLLQWYTSLTGGSPATAVTPSTASPGYTTYYVSQHVAGCESDRAPQTVIVNAKPPLPGGDTVFKYCQGDAVQPLSTNITGQNLLWYTTATGVGGSSTAPAISSATASIANYYVTQTINGCTSDRKHIMVTIIGKPTTPLVADTNYCSNSIALVLHANGQNLIWYNSATGTTGTSIPPVIPANTVVNDSVYYVTQTVNGCTSDKAAIHVNVYPAVVSAIIAPVRAVLCANDTMSFFYNDTVVVGNTYAWALPAGAIGIKGNLQGAGPITVRFGIAGNNTIALTVSNTKCSSTATYTVKVNSVPDADLVLTKDVCTGVRIPVQVINEKNTGSYIIDISGANIDKQDSALGIYYATWALPGVYTVTVKLSSGSGGACSTAVLEDTVVAYASPGASIEQLNGAIICIGDNLVMNAEQPTAGNIYKWAPASVFPTQKGASNVAVVNNDVEIYLDVTSSYGCLSVDSLHITTQPCCAVYFPNAFTPNRDAKNDVFRPVTEGNHDLDVFLIENRYGQMVYETRNEHQGWDGKFKGVPQGVGTYFYYMRYKCANNYQVLKGEFQLMR